MNSRTEKATKGIFTNFFQSILQIILQLSLVPIVLKMAGQETLGLYSIVIQILGYRILLDFGFMTAIKRYLSYAFGLNDEGKNFREVFCIGRVFSLFYNIILGILLFILSFVIDNFITMSSHSYKQLCLALYILTIWTIIRTPISLYDMALTARQNMDIVNIVGIISNIARLVFSLFLVYIGTGILGLMLSNVLAEVINFVLNSKLFKKRYPDYHFGWQIHNWRLFKEIFTFGFQYWGVNVAYLLFYGTDNIIVGYLLGTITASVYYTTKVPAFFLFQFIFTFADNSSPAVNELFAQSNYNSLQNAYLKLMRYSLILAVPIAIGIIGFNRYVVSLWVGPLQYGGDIMTIFLAMYVIFEVINHNNAMIAVASGDIRLLSLISIISGIICVVCSFLFGKLWGITGVMLGILLLEIPGFVYLFYCSLRSIKLQLKSLLNEIYNSSVIPISILLLILVVFIKILKPLSYIYIFSLAIVFLIIWFGGIFNKSLNSSEKKYIISFIKVRLCLR